MRIDSSAETKASRSKWLARGYVGLRAALPIVAALALLLGTSSQVWAGDWAHTVTLTPPWGVAGSQVKVVASTVPAGDPILVGYTTGNCPNSVTTIDGASGAADGSGNVAISFAWPNLSPGTYTVCVIDQKTHQWAQTQFTVLPTPSIAISSPVISGQPVTVTGKSWVPTSDPSGGGTVSVTYGVGGSTGCASAGGTATVDANGTFTITFNAPYETSDTSITITAVEPQGSCGSTSAPPTQQAQATATILVPSISAPAVVNSGDQITVTGKNFVASIGPVEVRYGEGTNGCANGAGTANVRADGTFTRTFTAPTESKDTKITITALQPQGSCSQPKLAATGTTQVKAGSSFGWQYCVVGLLLLLLLLLLLFLLFRGRRKEEPVTIEERDRVLVGANPANPSAGSGAPGGATLVDRQIVARDARGREYVIAEEVTTVEEEEEEMR